MASFGTPESKLAAAFDAGAELYPGDACRLLQSVARLFTVAGGARAAAAVRTPAFQWCVGQVRDSARRLRSRQLTQVWWSLAALAGSAGAAGWRPDADALDALAQQTRRQLGEFDAMGLTQCVWAHAKLGVEVPAALLKPLLDAVFAAVASFNAQDCANMLWAFAKQHAAAECGGNSSGMIRVRSVSLMLLAHAASEGVAACLKPMEIASIYWAAGSLQLRPRASDCAALVACMQTPRLVSAMTPQHVAMVLSGVHVFCAQGCLDDEDADRVLRALLERVQAVLSRFNPQTICNVFGSCAALFRVLFLGRAVNKIDLTETVAAFASRMLHASLTEMAHFSPRDISSLSSHLSDALTGSGKDHKACSTAFRRQLTEADRASALPCAAVLAALSARFVLGVEEFSPIDLARSLRAFVSCASVLSSEATAAATPDRESEATSDASSSRSHTLTASNFSSVDIPKIQKRIVVLLPELIPQDLSHILWAHAQGNFSMPRKLGRSLQARAVATIDSFTSQGMATMLWALAKGGQRALPVFVEAVVKKLTTQDQLAGMGGQEVSTMLWALASMMGGDGGGGGGGRHRQGLNTLVPPLCERVASVSENMNATDLVNTLWGLATISQNQLLSGDAAFVAALSAAKARLADNDLLEAFSAGQLALVLWSLGKLDSKNTETAMLGVDMEMLSAKIISELPCMHAQNIGMLTWGLGAARLRTSKRLVKALIARATEVSDDMNWQTVAHVEYFFLGQRSGSNSSSANTKRPVGKTKKMKSLFAALTLRATTLINEMRRSNRKETKALEDRVLVMAQEHLLASNDVLVVDASRRFFKGLKKILRNNNRAGSAAMASVHAWNRFSQGVHPGTHWFADGGCGGGGGGGGGRGTEEGTTPQQFSCAIVRLGIFNDAFDMVLRAVAVMLSPGAPLWVYGTDEEGIGSLSPRIAAIKGVASSSHVSYFENTTVRGQTARTVRSKVPSARGGGGVDAWCTRTRLGWLAGTDLKDVKWRTYPGLFAGGTMDTMTTFLLTTMRRKMSSADGGSGGAVGDAEHALDFCCGSGTILRFLAETWLEQGSGLREVEALDADAIAVRAARKNCKKCTAFHVSDCWNSVPAEKRYDLVVSNPPVHSFRADSFDVVMELVQGCSTGGRLRPGGTLWLVAQNYVPVGRMLDTAGGFAQVDLFSDGRFSAWRAVLHGGSEHEEVSGGGDGGGGGNVVVVEQGPPRKKLKRAEEAEEGNKRKKKTKKEKKEKKERKEKKEKKEKKAKKKEKKKKKKAEL
jgi:16S rRNA (guanine1207-N2)-methyltransferase